MLKTKRLERRVTHDRSIAALRKRRRVRGQQATRCLSWVLLLKRQDLFLGSESRLQRRKVDAMNRPARLHCEGRGHARTRTMAGETLAVLVTRFLDGSIPYRTLFHAPSLEPYPNDPPSCLAENATGLSGGSLRWPLHS